LSGKADDGEGRKARPDLDLDIDGAGLDPLEGNRRDTREHRQKPPFGLRPTALGSTLAKMHAVAKNIQRTFLSLWISVLDGSPGSSGCAVCSAPVTERTNRSA
jgi:hypothetical protein